MKLWYEVYFLDKTEDLMGGNKMPANGEQQASGHRVPGIGDCCINVRKEDSWAGSLQWTLN